MRVCVALECGDIAVNGMWPMNEFFFSMFGSFVRGVECNMCYLNSITLCAVVRRAHSVAECQFSTNLIITFDRNKIQTSNWYHFVSLVKAIRMTYNKALTDQVMTLIRGIFKLYDLK